MKPICRKNIGSNFKEKRILFLLLSSNILEYEKICQKKHKNKIIMKNFIYNRFCEQILVFLFICTFYCSGTYIYTILSYNKSKWIYPFSFNENISVKEKKNSTGWLKNTFMEEIKINENISEIQELKKKFQKVDILASFCSFFIIINKFLREKLNYNFQIFTIYFSKIQKKDVVLWGKLFYLAKSFSIQLDFVNFSNKDIDIFHYGSYLTKGIYCKPIEPMHQIVISKKFFKIIITVFFPSALTRQILVLPLATKSSFFYFFQTLKNKKWFVCSYCLSVYSSIFPKCLICGNTFLY